MSVAYCIIDSTTGEIVEHGFRMIFLAPRHQENRLVLPIHHVAQRQIASAWQKGHFAILQTEEQPNAKLITSACGFNIYRKMPLELTLHKEDGTPLDKYTMKNHYHCFGPSDNGAPGDTFIIRHTASTPVVLWDGFIKPICEMGNEQKFVANVARTYNFRIVSPKYYSEIIKLSAKVRYTNTARE